MDIRSLFSKQAETQAEKQAQQVNLLFDGNPELIKIFAYIATEDAEFYQQIFNKSHDALKRWFLHPEDYMQAVQALALLTPFFGPEKNLDALGQTWLLPAIRFCLNGMESGFNMDTEIASRKVASHLLELNPEFTDCNDLEQTRMLLQEMFGDQLLHWQLLLESKN